jgi:hypothetical protein
LSSHDNRQDWNRKLTLASGEEVTRPWIHFPTVCAARAYAAHLMKHIDFEAPVRVSIFCRSCVGEAEALCGYCVGRRVQACSCV